MHPHRVPPPQGPQHALSIWRATPLDARASCTTSLLRLLDRQEQLELSRQLVLRVQPVRKVDPPDPAVGVDLHTQGLDVVGAVCPTSKIRKVELNLVPALVKTHRHRTDERLDPRGGLVVGCAE